VANRGDGTISVIDTPSNTVIATVNIGAPTPAFPAITSDGLTLYVSTGKTITAVDTGTNSVTASIAVDASGGMAITPDGAFVYALGGATGSGNGSVTVIDTATNAPVGSPIVAVFNPDAATAVPGVVITPDGASVYASAENISAASAIATATNTVTAQIPLSNVSLRGVAVTPDGSHVYVAAEAENVVYGINTATNSQQSETLVGNGPFGIAVTPDGAFVYVTNFAGNSVSIIATATNTVVGSPIPIGSGPDGIAIANLATPITQCGTVISQPGSYVVANDLYCMGIDAIDIIANNVTLLLNNHQIAQGNVTFGFTATGISVGVGVHAGNSHATITGPGTITGFMNGISFEQVSHSSVTAVTSTGNSFGFVINGGFAAGCNQACPSTRNQFLGNTSTFNDQHGFSMNGANTNTFLGNNSSGNVNGFGFLLFTAVGNKVQNNTANGNGGPGIGISAGTGTSNTVHNNTAQNNGNLDLFDGNSNCDSNVWKKDTFGTANQPCIH
jgi:YVTN family beta-propeller protein